MSQVWIITGAGRGLGRAIAGAALAASHSVLATTRSGTADIESGDPTSDRLLVMPLEVTTPDQRLFNGIAEAAVSRFGRIDVLVNNAGYGTTVIFEESDESQIRAIFETNVFGLMRMTRAVLPVMRRQGSGHVFNVSSMAGYVGGSALYSATKFAVTGYTESLALELRPFGITATNVAPGYFRTDFLDPSSDHSTPSCELSDYDTFRNLRNSFVRDRNHTQTGDPAALGKLLVAVARSARPPVHLPIGADAIKAIEKHERDLAADLAAWQEQATATTLPPA
jgi:NAD(P)-dependent dehydrogenase (short-subunit alcohol dehydrogenase family)